MHIVLRDLAEEKSGGEKLLIADFVALEILEVKIVLVPSVVAVAQDRVPQMGELGADLMGPSGYQFHFDVRYIFSVRTDTGIDSEDTIAGSDGKITVLRDIVDEDIAGGRLLQVGGDFLHDGFVLTDDIGADIRYPAYQTAVTLGDQVILEKRDRIFQTLLVLGGEDQTTCIHVNAVTQIQGRIMVLLAQDIDEGVAGGSLAGMYGQTLSFIDQQKVIGFENDFKVGNRRILLDFGGFEKCVRKPDLHCIPFGYGKIGGDPLAVDADILMLEGFLQNGWSQIGISEDRGTDHMLSGGLR